VGIEGGIEGEKVERGTGQLEVKTIK